MPILNFVIDVLFWVRTSYVDRVQKQIVAWNLIELVKNLDGICVKFKWNLNGMWMKFG